MSKIKLDCVERISEWDESLAEKIYSDIKEKITEEAEVDWEVFQKAYSLVVYSGYFGPFHSDPDEENGMLLSEAEKIVFKAVRVTFEDYEYFDPNYDFVVDEEDNEINNVTLEGSTIRKEFFKQYHKIYG